MGSTEGNFCTKPSSKCLECLSGLLLLAIRRRTMDRTVHDPGFWAWGQS